MLLWLQIFAYNYFKIKEYYSKILSCSIFIKTYQVLKLNNLSYIGDAKYINLSMMFLTWRESGEEYKYIDIFINNTLLFIKGNAAWDHQVPHHTGISKSRCQINNISWRIFFYSYVTHLWNRCMYFVMASKCSFFQEESRFTRLGILLGLS